MVVYPPSSLSTDTCNKLQFHTRPTIKSNKNIFLCYNHNMKISLNYEAANKCINVTNSMNSLPCKQAGCGLYKNVFVAICNLLWSAGLGIRYYWPSNRRLGRAREAQARKLGIKYTGRFELCADTSIFLHFVCANKCKFLSPFFCSKKLKLSIPLWNYLCPLLTF